MGPGKVKPSASYRSAATQRLLDTDRKKLLLSANLDVTLEDCAYGRPG